jgi:hypothetical protein
VAGRPGRRALQQDNASPAWDANGLTALGNTRASEAPSDELLRACAKASLYRVLLNPASAGQSVVMAARISLELTGDVRPADKWALATPEQLRAALDGSNGAPHVDHRISETAGSLDQRYRPFGDAGH